VVTFGARSSRAGLLLFVKVLSGVTRGDGAGLASSARALLLLVLELAFSVWLLFVLLLAMNDRESASLSVP
jgi:hypothetical protein